MRAVLALCWPGLVLAVAWRARPVPLRLPAPAHGPPPATGPRHRRPLDAAVGAVVLGWAGRSAHPAAARRLGRAVLAAGAALPLSPAAAPAVGLVVWSLPLWTRRRARHSHDTAVRAQLPEVVDLFALAVGAGLTVPLAVAAVARRARAPLAAELARVVDDVRLGRRWGEALEELPRRAGEPVRPLVAALVTSERYGAPLLDGLVRLAVELRADRRRRAEDAARRVPVKLLFPLVFCTLPAFALLTVVPLVAGALSALRIS